MKGYSIGGALLGSRNQAHDKDVASWKCFEPIISPMIPLRKDQQQRFILLPHQRYISVLAYNTAATVAHLVPQLRDQLEEEDVSIESVCLLKETRSSKMRMQQIADNMDVDESEDEADESSEEVILMIGCSDGTIREFDLASLGALENSGAVKCGRYHVNGPCCYPRRVIHVTKKEPIIQIASPTPCDHKHGVLAYVVSRTKNFEQSELENKKAVSNVNVAVLRVLIPHFDGTTNASLLSKTADDIQRKKHIDSIKCRVGRDKTNSFLNTTPFQLLAVSRKQPGKWLGRDAVFLILARANAIHIYYEDLDSEHRFSPISFPMSATNPLSSISVARNNSDIACGHMKGQIKILNDVLNNLESYNLALADTSTLSGPDGAAMKPIDPRKQLITSKVHWHAHPVTSIVYAASSSPVDPILHSGGEESVLVSWQPSRGTDKPVDMLPRIALGGIVHVVCAHSIDEDPASGILVYCDDNSLQLFESHSKGKKWKLQGLACKAMDEKAKHPIIEVDPRAKGSKDAPIVITGLPEAPGFMHWYDSSKQNLLGSLEVAPFNRVSRTESNESTLPTPSITSHAFSENGNELITLEETLTENVYVGAHDSDGNNAHGIVSTIRFWSWNNSSTSTQKQLPYTLSAAMTYPHGPKNRVSSLAVTKNGLVACTMSNDEKAFRIWTQSKIQKGNSEPSSWACRYKVTIPAGFSNFQTAKGGIAFSEDGSVLALSFGGMVTLWETDGARYLAAIRHLDDINSCIDHVEFVSFGGLHDLLLVKSPSGVSLQSPFPQCVSFTGWCWGIPAEVKGISVKDVALATSANCLAVALFDSNKEQSRIVLIDAPSGIAGVKTASTDGVKLIGKIDGCIMSLCSTSEELSGWDESTSTKTIDFFALTSTGRLLKFTDGISESAATLAHATAAAESSGPRLEIERGDSSKRQRLDYYGVLSDTSTRKGKTALEMFGITISDDGTYSRPLSSELPTLDDDFVTAFVRRNL